LRLTWPSNPATDRYAANYCHPKNSSERLQRVELRQSMSDVVETNFGHCQIKSEFYKAVSGSTVIFDISGMQTTFFSHYQRPALSCS